MEIEEDIKKLIIEFLKLEKGKKGTHLPGYNYCGPGTPIVSNILKNVTPINDLDKGCQIHDIEYMEYAGNYEMLRNSDKKLINISNSWINKDKNIFKRFFHWLASKSISLTFTGKKLLENMGFIDPVEFTKKLSVLDINSENKIGEFLKNLISAIDYNKKIFEINKNLNLNY